MHRELISSPLIKGSVSLKSVTTILIGNISSLISVFIYFVIWNVCVESGLQSLKVHLVSGFFPISVCNLLWHLCYCSNQLVEKEEKLMNLSVAFPYSMCRLEFIHGHFLGSISILWFCHLWNDTHNGVQQSVYCREHHLALISNMLISQYCSFIFSGF